ncbi:hypothetical protein CTI12_AA044400 [Artemisia annua]|uniref:Helitron helicase-like domain-containing protein n=1 Tax=Artemisia annua TaxID=35608 RepID=A0A2U1QDA0_ARTAN|nr:hypothetical protein CTI12_AA044400 [Artemisia annua]
MSNNHHLGEGVRHPPVSHDVDAHHGTYHTVVPTNVPEPIVSLEHCPPRYFEPSCSDKRQRAAAGIVIRDPQVVHEHTITPPSEPTNFSVLDKGKTKVVDCSPDRVSTYVGGINWRNSSHGMHITCTGGVVPPSSLTFNRHEQQPGSLVSSIAPSVPTWVGYHRPNAPMLLDFVAQTVVPFLDAGSEERPVAETTIGSAFRSCSLISDSRSSVYGSHQPCMRFAHASSAVVPHSVDPLTQALHGAPANLQMRSANDQSQHFPNATEPQHPPPGTRQRRWARRNTPRPEVQQQTQSTVPPIQGFYCFWLRDVLLYGCHFCVQMIILFCFTRAFVVAGPPSMYRSFGPCDRVCLNCGARFWLEEKIVGRSTSSAPCYNRCCLGGSLKLRSRQQYSDYIHNLFSSGHFMDNIRAYNQMFAMTSLGANIDESINSGRGPYVFKVSGQIYHRIGGLCPPLGKDPRFLQLYIYDTQHEATNRLANFSSSGRNTLDAEVVQGLIHFLDGNNALVQLFRTARDKIQQQDVPEFKVRLFGVTRNKQYELPTSDSIGAIVYDSGPETETDFDMDGKPHCSYNDDAVFFNHYHKI